MNSTIVEMKPAHIERSAPVSDYNRNPSENTRIEEPNHVDEKTEAQTGKHTESVESDASITSTGTSVIEPESFEEVFWRPRGRPNIKVNTGVKTAGGSNNGHGTR